MVFGLLWAYFDLNLGVLGVMMPYVFDLVTFVLMVLLTS